MQKKTLFLTLALIIGVSFFIGVNFVKADATSTGEIIVVSPNGGETFTAGSVQVVTWSYNQNLISASSSFNIYLIGGPGATPETYTIGSYISLPSGSATSTILETDVIMPPTASAGLYRIMIDNSSVGGAVYTDYSDDYFTINAATPSITVTSPNGGEVWVASSSQVITWTSNATSTALVRIDLLTPGGVVAHTFSDTLNDGSETITVPANLAAANLRLYI